MTNTKLAGTVLATTVVATGLNSAATDSPSVDELIAKIKDKDDKVRGPAWQAAGVYGASAVKPLAVLMSDSDMEVARSAKRALWKIVRRAGGPDSSKDKGAVAMELVDLLNGQPTPTRREALWMLSEIGGNDTVKPVAALLSDRETREDARAALERIPGDASVAALKAALESVPEDFKPAVAQSLRVRGLKISGYPSQKLVPTRPTGAATPKTS